MKQEIRSHLCRFIGLMLWWAALIPGIVFSVEHTISFFLAATLTLIAWGLVQFNIFTRIAKICFPVGIAAMLLLSKGQWIMPPALWGVLYVMGLAAIFWLRIRILNNDNSNETSIRPESDKNNQTNNLKDEQLDTENVRSQKKYQDPYYTKTAAFFLIWMIGIFLSIIISNIWTSVILLIWSSIMLVAGYNIIWPFINYPDWIGYKVRRTIYTTSPAKWRIKIIVSIILSIIFITFLIII